MRVVVRYLGWVGAALLMSVGLAAGQALLGDEFQINSSTINQQQSPATATLANGDFVVVWHSDTFVYPEGTRLMAQRYASDGAVLGSELVVVEIARYGLYHKQPRVAAASTGDFVVVWQTVDAYSPSTSPNVNARIFSSAGNPVGGSIAVNEATTGSQEMPSVAMLDNDEFVVVWSEPYTGPGPDNFALARVNGRRFTSAGTALAVEFRADGQSGEDRVNTEPDVAAGAAGSFAVVWQSTPKTGSDQSADVYARLFAAPIIAQGDQIMVNVFSTNNQSRPAVAGLGGGEFAVVWDSYYSYGDIIGRRLEPGGLGLATIGNEFQVNTSNYNRIDENPSISGLPSAGGFVVVWARDDFFDNSAGIAGRVVSSAGVPMGTDFVVNTYTAGPFLSRYQHDPAVTAGNGLVTISWGSDGTAIPPGDDNNMGSISGRFMTAPALFADGFESGSTASWSTTMP